MKTIIIGLNWLGDIIMSLPSILAAAGNSEVHVITRPHLAEVYRLFGDKITIHPVDTRAGIFNVYQSLKPIRELKARHTIVLPDSFRAAAVARLCGSRQIIGFASQWRSLLLQQSINKPGNFKQMHESDLHFLLVKSAGLAENKPDLPPVNFSQDIRTSLAGKTGFAVGQQYFVLAPGAAFGAAKRWPPQKFAQLATLIDQHYKQPIVLTGSAGEKQLAEEISAATTASLLDLTGRTSLTELALLLANARALVANDSGTMHLAALNATPSVIPVGPTDMVRTGPLNKNCRTVIATNCPQAPCRQRTCPRHDHICMSGITAEMIFATLVEQETTSNAKA